jgi:hypothetical protein
MNGWLRRAAMGLIGVLALSAVAAFGPAREADAAPYVSPFCWHDWSSGHLEVHCVDIEVVWPWDEYIDCWMCGLSLEWEHDPVIRVELEAVVGEQVVKGVGKLGQAEFTRDAALRSRLRAEAMDAFTAAARYSGESTMSVEAIGTADPAKNTFRADPQPEPWSVAAGVDIADGVALLQRSFEDPANAARLRSLAAAQFDEAYDELSQQRVIGG